MGVAQGDVPANSSWMEVARLIACDLDENPHRPSPTMKAILTPRSDPRLNPDGVDIVMMEMYRGMLYAFTAVIVRRTLHDVLAPSPLTGFGLGSVVLPGSGGLAAWERGRVAAASTVNGRYWELFNVYRGYQRPALADGMKSMAQLEGYRALLDRIVDMLGVHHRSVSSAAGRLRNYESVAQFLQAGYNTAGLVGLKTTAVAPQVAIHDLGTDVKAPHLYDITRRSTFPRDIARRNATWLSGSERILAGCNRACCRQEIGGDAGADGRARHVATADRIAPDSFRNIDDFRERHAAWELYEPGFFSIARGPRGGVLTVAGLEALIDPLSNLPLGEYGSRGFNPLGCPGLFGGAVTVISQWFIRAAADEVLSGFALGHLARQKRYHLPRPLTRALA